MPGGNLSWFTEYLQEFFRALFEALGQYNISLVAGHTEITTSVKSPGLFITMFGEVRRENMIRTSGARAGDVLILTGGAGIEGTSLIANDLRSDLEGKISAEILERARGFIFDPGICIAEAAYIAWQHKPNALHDPTEGGVRKGIEELYSRA